MKDDITVGIIKLCLAIDRKASEIYHYLFQAGDDTELKAFWAKMATEEEAHLAYWKELLRMARRGFLPQVLADPVKVRDELENANRKVDALVQMSRQNPSLTNAFLLAYRLEFYVLHPAIAQLFHFIKVTNDAMSPEDTYDKHISSFIEAMNRFGASTPELELLGETIQKLWHENKQLVEQSSLDPLTGLYNRFGFYKFLTLLTHLALRNKFHVAIIMIDIDHFKKVNDTHGHQAGDRVLRSVGQLLQKNTRSSDLVGRFGGEEIIVFLSSLDPRHLGKLCEKLRSMVETETKQDIPVTISIGAVSRVFEKKPEEETEKMIGEADRCLYRAKDGGRNRVEISSST